MQRLVGAIVLVFAGCSGPDTIPNSTGKIVLPSEGPRWQWHEVEVGRPTALRFVRAPDGLVITSHDGLAGDVIHQIVMLRDGSIAFATNAGLSIWNGREIASYTGPWFNSAEERIIAGNSGLPGNNIHDLAIDRLGRLWIATSEGVCRIDENKMKILSVETPRRAKGPSPPLGDVQAIFVMADGRVILGSRRSGITIVDPLTDTAKTIYCDDDLNHCVSGIAEDSAGTIWFAVSGLGVLAYDSQLLRIFDPFNSPRWVLDKNIRSICIAPDKSLWLGFGSGSGLARVSPDGKVDRFTSADALPGSIVWRLSVDRSGAVWALTHEGAAVYRGKWRYPVLPSGFFRGGGCVFQDWKGGYWLGGIGAISVAMPEMGAVNPREAAITQFKRRVEERYPEVPEPALRSRFGAARDSAGNIIGYEAGHLLSYDGKTWQDITDILDEHEVWNLQADKKGRVWVCTGGAGLIGIQGKKVERFNDVPTHSKSCVYGIAEGPSGELYVGTQYGLWRLKGEQWDDLSGPANQIMQVTQLVVDQRGRVWVLDPNYGLFVYNEKEFTPLCNSPPLLGKTVTRLTLTRDGGVETEAVDRSQNPAVTGTYRWVHDTPILRPDETKK